MNATAPTKPSAPRPDPEWLTPDQQRDWRSYLQGAALLTDALSRALEDEFGLSIGDYELMVRLSEAPGRSLRMSQLAAELVHSRSRVTYAVGSMERRGYVTRGATKDDRRGVSCTLTDSGWQLLQEAAKVHVASVRAYFVDVIGPCRLHHIGEAMALVTAAERERSRNNGGH